MSCHAAVQESRSLSEFLRLSPHWDSNFCKADYVETAKVTGVTPVPAIQPSVSVERMLIDIYSTTRVA